MLTLICTSFCMYQNLKRLRSPTRIKKCHLGMASFASSVFFSSSLFFRALQPSGVGDDVCHVSYSRGSDCVCV